MDEKELRKFNYEFIKENNPDLNFVLYTEGLMNWVSNVPKKNQDLARLYLTKLTDKLEANYLNATLETTYSNVTQKKRNLLEVDEIDQVEQKRYFARSSQFKGRFSIKPESTPTTKPTSPSTIDIPSEKEPKHESQFKEETPMIAQEVNNYFDAGWTKKAPARSKNVNAIIRDILNDPDAWEKQMNDSFDSVFQGKEILEECLNKDITFDALYKSYTKLAPGYGFVKMDKKDRREEKMKQTLVALTLYLRAKRMYAEDEYLVFGHLRQLLQIDPPGSLWRHCKHVYTFYQQLGDMVILIPDVFDKTFLLQYPPAAIQPFLDVLKSDLSPRITGLQRFSTILNESFEK